MAGIPVTETLDDGVYIDQATPVAGVPSGVPGFEMCLIGPGSRTKNINSEAVIRGLVTDETLTVAATTPFTATLAAGSGLPKTRSTRNSDHTAIYANGAQLDISQWSWVTPTIVSDGVDYSGNVNLGAVTFSSFGLKIDGLPSLTIVLYATNGGGPVVGDVLLAGTGERQITVAATTAASLGAVAGADIVTAINAALHSAQAQALGYSGVYAYASIDGSNNLVITGNTATPSTSAGVWAMDTAALAANNCLEELLGVETANASNRSALSVIRIRDDIYNTYGAAATYKADYVRVADNAIPTTLYDTPATTGVQSITSVGVRSGSADFVKDTDWQETAAPIKVDWSPDASATVDSLGQNFDLEVAVDGFDTIKLGFDGYDPEEMDLYGLSGLGDPTAGGVIGYANPSSETAATAAEVAVNINALSAYYFGPEYRAVAAAATSGAATVVRLSSYVQGIAGVIEFELASTNDASASMFGLTLDATDTRLADQGEGRVPDAGSVYYLNYLATRPAAEYNRRRLFRDSGFAQQELGYETSLNPLATCVQMAFEMGTSLLSTIQVDDASAPGSPTRGEFRTALFATDKSASITEIVPLTTSSAVHIDLMELLAVRNSGQAKKYSRGYIGAPAGTELGDTDQQGTLIYLGKRTYQVSDPSSPARGRLMGFVAPTKRALTRTVNTTIFGEETISMTGYHYATVAAARRMTFQTPKTTLAKKSCNVFDATDVDDDELWSDSERVLLKSAGWCALSYNGGQFAFGSPVTFEYGRASRADEFSYDNTSPQKDNAYRAIIATLDANLTSAVPSNPTDFALTMRSLIANALNAQIPNALANYQDGRGVARPIDPQVDIDVKRASEEGGSRVRWLFSFSAFLAYPALEFVGTAYWDRGIPAFGAIGSADLL